MEFGHPLLQVFIHPVVCVQPPTKHRIIYGLAARQDQAAVVLCDLQDEFRSGFVEMVVLHPAQQIGPAHGSHDDAVFDLAVADLERREQRIICRIHDCHKNISICENFNIF